jgi:hypothetical protein
LQQYKGIAKFKDEPIRNEEENAIMFEDIRNTGDGHWAPSSGNALQEKDIMFVGMVGQMVAAKRISSILRRQSVENSLMSYIAWWQCRKGIYN